MRLNYIDNIDCLEGMKAIPDGSVDAVITDPPYGTMLKSRSKSKEHRDRLGVFKDHKWDKVVPSEDLLAEWGRVLRPNGRLISFCMEPLTSDLITRRPPLLNFNYKLYWVKNSPGLSLGSKKNPLSYVEEMVVFTRSTNPPSFDADKQHPLRAYFIEEKEKSGLEAADFRRLLGSGMASHYFTQGEQFIIPTEANYRKLQSTGFFTKPWDEIRTTDAAYKAEKQSQRMAELEEYQNTYPAVFNLPDGQKSKSNIFRYTKDANGQHPTQKPVDLVIDLIETYTNPGATVLDPFMGSGTTAVACLRTGRNYIGFELDERYHEIAQNRIAEEVDRLLAEELA